MNRCIKYLGILIILMAFAAVGVMTAAGQPVISDIGNDTPTTTTVNITWTTDENSNSLVKYGDTSGTYTDEESDVGAVISHNIKLSGLSAGATYYYVVNSTNTTTGSSQSAEKDFTTASSSDTTPPVISDIGNDTPTTATVNITWTTDENSNSLVKYGDTSGTYTDEESDVGAVISHNIKLSGLSVGATYYYVVNSTDGSGNSAESSVKNFITASASTPPSLSIYNVKNTTTSSSATITWTTNNDSDSRVKYGMTSGDYEKEETDATNETDHSITLTDLEADTTYYFRVNSTDESSNSAESVEYEFKTEAEGHSTGFRIWDEDKEMDLNYTWTARSYTGFYYDIDDDISTETLTVQLDPANIRNIEEDNLQYITTAADLEFEYNEGRDDERWGSYKVIGFMAEKYFAGYEDDNTSIATENIRLLSKDMLSKVLIDEDEKHMISTGASLKLKEDYELKIIQLDIDGGQAQIDLMKDGKSVDSDIVTSPDTYVYTEDIRKLDDVPLVAVHIDNVFAGTESDMLVIDGIFQISDDFIPVDTGEDYGEMEIQSASGYTIRMENSDDIELEEDEIVDIMGNLKFLVADNDTLRFALYEEITEPGTHDIRGTVYDTGEATWDHMNFEGFYYNIHDDLGTETLRVEECSGNTIPEDGLVYETTAQPVEFDLGKWGYFDVVGFMAEPYFAGYKKGVTNEDITNDNINLLSKDMLSKVLIDVEDDRMISTGASLQLEEGYELKIMQLDIDGGQAQIELLKNGKSVDSDIVTSPDTYVYTEDLGKLDDVPLVVVYIGNVFAGTESDLVTIEGVFQISDDPISVDSGDEYGEMEITSASGDKITMKNKENIDLEGDETVMIMENIGFATSEDEDRYYLFVRRTIGSIAALKIELPEGLIINEDIVITITADGDPVEGVQVQFAGANQGLTDSDGKVTIRSEEAGTFTIIANKENYDSASVDIRILTESEAERDPLKIVMQDTAEPGEDVVIKVSYKGDAIDNASIIWDGDDIGDTDETGSLTYTVEDEGIYTVTANKDGYLEGKAEIEVAYPSAEFELKDLTFPENVSANKEFTVSVDVTNTGNADGTYLAELKVNDSVVDSQNVTLDTGDTEKIEFTTKIAEAGTVTIGIGTESGEITVTKSKSNTMLIAAVLIVLALLGAIGYLLISSAPEGGWTVGRLSDAIKDKLQRGGKGL
ncbi:MAG: S-layer protein domain-containing protein [Euryarchaeota archaeon]|nr:S-layer protein domain-containing protein [Euryarchaeota archaeon]